LKNSKSLKEIVKELQFLKKWTVEQVAESIGYSRVHLTKEMAKTGENDHLKKLLLDKHKDILNKKASTVDDVDAFLVTTQIGQEAMLQTILEFLAEIGGGVLGRSAISLLGELQKRVEEKKVELQEGLGRTA
jgi:hypothetical protein